MNGSIDPLLHEEVRPLLEPGEVLLWADRPDPLRFARARIVQALSWALLFLLLVLVLYPGRAGSGVTVNAALLSLFVRPAAMTAGVLLMLSSMLLPVLAYRKALRTVFAATDRRVLSLSRAHPVLNMRYSDMQAPVLDLLSVGAGDIRFRRSGPDDSTRSEIGQLHFRGVKDAEDLHQLVLKRLSGPADGGIAYGNVPDYIDLLARGKRSLNDDPFRK
jgi:hypothetical protein